MESSLCSSTTVPELDTWKVWVHQWVTILVNRCPLESPVTHLPHSSFSSTLSFWIYTSLYWPWKSSHMLSYESLFLSFTIKLQKITHLYFLIISLLIKSDCPASPLTIKSELNPISFYKTSLSLLSLKFRTADHLHCLVSWDSTFSFSSNSSFHPLPGPSLFPQDLSILYVMSSLAIASSHMLSTITPMEKTAK